MSDNDKSRKERKLLFAAIAESVLDATDEEILAEIKEQGLDPEKVAAGVIALFQKLIRYRRKSVLDRLKKYEPCPDCDGKGAYSCPEFASDPRDSGWYTCEKCGGTGRLKL